MHRPEVSGETLPGDEVVTSKRPTLVRSSGMVMAAFVVSKIVGLLRERAIAHRFGATADYDAYVAAFAIPDVLFTLIGGGALVSAFVPVFSEALAKRDTRLAWSVASGVTNIVFLLTLVASSVAAIGAPTLVRDWLAPGFATEQQALTASLMRIVLLGTLVFGVSGLQMGILNAFQRFLLPALAPIAYNLAILGSAIWLAPSHGVHGLAYGVVLGALLHLAIKVPGLVACGFQWHARLGLELPETRRVFWLMWPRVLALATVRLAALVTTRLGSQLAPGSLSAFNYAWLIAQMPQTVLGSAVGTVVFPTLAEQHAMGERKALASTTLVALRALVLLTVPASGALAMLASSIVDLLLRTGAFGGVAAQSTSIALTMLAAGLVGHVTLEVVARAFYAQQDTLTPLLASALAMTANIGLATWLVQPLGVAGLGLSNSLAVSFEVLLLLAWLHQRLPELELGPLATAAWQALLATLLMSAAIRGALVVAEQELSLGRLAAFPRGLIEVGLGAAVGCPAYVVGLACLGTPEATAAFRKLRWRWHPTRRL